MKTFKNIIFYPILILFAFFMVGACSSDKSNLKENEARYNRLAKAKIAELHKDAILLGLKNDLSTDKVQDVLFEYLKIYNNYDYQLVTTKTIDMEIWRALYRTEPIEISHFIKSTANVFCVSEKIVAGVVLDYEFRQYRERLSDLESSIEELSYDIDNMN